MRFVNLSTLLILLLITSCSKNDNNKTHNGPDWIVDTYIISSSKDEVSAVGTAKKTQNITTQLMQAEINARKILENQIGINVSKLIHNTIKKIHIRYIDRDKKVFAKITHNLIHNIPLSRSRRTNIWIDKKTGTLFIRMIANLDDLTTYLKNSITQYNDELLKQGVTKNDLHTFNTELSDSFAQIGKIIQEDRYKKLRKQ